MEEDVEKAANKLMHELEYEIDAEGYVTLRVNQFFGFLCVILTAIKEKE